MIDLRTIAHIKAEMSLRQVSDLYSFCEAVGGLTIVPSQFLPKRGVMLYLGEEIYEDLCREIASKKKDPDK